MLKPDFIPVLPFPEYKWKWASVQCTEGLNDPVVLLGVLQRMRKLELLGRGLRYSSDEFAREMADLSSDISDSIDINLSSRTGERNLIRNSGQYWRALGLIPSVTANRGQITLTPFGQKVADHDISQSEFAAIVILSLSLPNPRCPIGEGVRALATARAGFQASVAASPHPCRAARQEPRTRIHHHRRVG